jgi:glutathione S-transferase
MLEIHGKRECPFAWRVRLVAREKGAPFEWVPYDVTSPDARARQHNPERRSPLLWDAGFTLSESIVIAGYIDETYPGRTLLPSAPRPRAQARLLLATLVPKLEALPARADDEDEAVAKARAGHAALDAALSDAQPWLGGELPLLPDLMIWPFLAVQEEGGAPVPAELSSAAAYWRRAREHPSLAASRP